MNKKRIVFILTILVVTLNVFSMQYSKQMLTSVTTKEINNGLPQEILPSTVDVNCELICEWDEVFGECADICIYDNYAYIAAIDGGVQIFDLSDPAEPSFAGCYEEGIEATSISVRDSLAYVCCIDEFYILNVSDPQNIIQIGHLSHPSTFGKSITLVDDCVFLGLMFGGLKIINISNPFLPVQVAYYTGLSYNIVQVQVFEQYAYLCYFNDGLEIVNVTDLANPTFICNLGDSYTISDVAVSNDMLFMIGIEDTIQVYNISNIGTPTLLKDYKSILGLYISISNIILADSILAIFSGAQIVIVNVSDVANPVFLDSFGSGEYNICGDTQNGILVAGGLNVFLYVFNVTDPSNLIRLAEIANDGSVYDFWVKDNYAFVTTEMFGLSVVDFSDKENPVEVDSLYSISGNGFTEIVGKDNHLYVTDSRDVYVVDVSDPTDVSIVGSIINDGYGYSLFIQGNTLFETTENGLLIYDITVPNSPSFVGEYGTESDATNVWVEDNYAFICGDFNGIDVVNVTDIQNPSFIDSFGESYAMNRDITVNNDRVYIMNYNYGILVFKIDTIASIHLIRSFNYLSGLAGGLYSQGHWIYTATFGGGMHILNFYNATKYPIIGYYNDLHRCYNVRATNHTIYFADGMGGFKIVQLNMDDADNDFLPDYLETVHYYTDMNDPDTDKDGILDGIEAFQGTDPNNVNDPISQTKRFGYTLSVLMAFSFICFAIFTIHSRTRKKY